MSIVLGSVSQRLKGCVPFKLVIMLVVCSLVLTDVASGLFYTDSKEHDYPRIGRRSGSDKVTGALEDSGAHRAYKHLFNRMSTKGRLHISSSIAFRAWDTNGDGFLSRSEFDPRMDRILGRAP